MIINNTYFVGEIFLAQVGQNASTLVNSENKLQNFIDEYEVDLIELALGKKLSDEFYTNIDPVTGTLLVTADPKWDRLLNGHSYVKNGITYFWRGLIETKGSLPKSLLAYYIYYKFVQDGVKQKTTLGVVKAEGKNASDGGASAISTLTKAWRKMHEWYGDSYCYDYGYGVHYSYKGAHVSDYFGGRDNTKKVSLYTFMTDNEADYDDWYFTPLENQNQFGI